jgi:hypothetical protein
LFHGFLCDQKVQDNLDFNPGVLKRQVATADAGCSNNVVTQRIVTPIDKFRLVGNASLLPILLDFFLGASKKFGNQWSRVGILHLTASTELENPYLFLSSWVNSTSLIRERAGSKPLIFT